MSKDVEEILDELEDASHDGTVTLREMAEAMGHRGAAPFLVVPPLIEISPLGGIPGVPTLLALLVAIFAVQIAMGRDEPAMPGVVGRRGIDGSTLRSAIEKMRPVAERLDRWFHGRMAWLTTKPSKQVAMVVVLGLCASVPPLEVVPFASTMPMAAILLFGLALLFRDGLLMLVAFAGSLAALGGIVWALGRVGIL